MITGWKETTIREVYVDVCDEETNSLPLNILPMDVQEKYVYGHLYHDLTLDIDLARLTGTEQKSFFAETDIVRKTYFAGRNGDLLRFIADINHFSVRTLERRKKTFMQETNLNRLIKHSPESYIYSDKHNSLCVYAADYWFFRKIHSDKVTDNKVFRELTQNLKDFKCVNCPYSYDWQRAHPREKIPFMCSRETDTIVIPRSRKPLNALRREIEESDIDMERKGVHYWDSHYSFTGRRKKPDLVNYAWYSDHTCLDIFVITGTKPDGSPKSERVWLTGMLDSATNALVGYCLTTDPNTQSIAEAFTRAAVYTVDTDFVGLPRHLYIDNGKDYRSKQIEGSSETKPIGDACFTEEGMLSWLGVEVHHALPYKGRSKTIERVWRTIEEQWIADLPGYSGSNPEERPYRLEANRKSGNLYTFQQFADYFAETIYPGYNNFKSDPNKKSPSELYHEKERAKTLVPTWRTMCALMYRTEDRILQQQGIRYDNRWYWHPRLARLTVGTPVKVMTFDAPFNRTIGVIKDRSFIAEAHPVQELDLIEGKRYKIFQHLEMQAKQRARVKSQLTELKRIILLSNIADVGAKIPPIEKLSYVPEVDTTRDKQAKDDPRIPDELKDVAEQHYNNRDTLNDSEEEAPISIILRDIGDNVIKASERTMI